MSSRWRHWKPGEKSFPDIIHNQPFWFVRSTFRPGDNSNVRWCDPFSSPCEGSGCETRVNACLKTVATHLLLSGIANIMVFIQGALAYKLYPSRKGLILIGSDSSANAGCVNTGVTIVRISKQGHLLPVRTLTSALWWQISAQTCLLLKE